MKPNDLEAAIRAGNLDKIRELIAAGADVSTAFADGTTPILLAAREGEVTILRALAAAGADLTDLESLDFQERLKLFADSSLDHESADDLLSTSQLSTWILRALAEKMDPRVATQIADMEGPLCRAVRTGDLELLTESIAAGADLEHLLPVTRDTALTLAVQKREEEMVIELVRAGANVNHEGYSTPLSFALPDLRLAKILLDAGADVDVRGLDHQTPLQRAVHRALSPDSSEDSLLLVRFFLEAGVHPPSAESFEGSLLREAELSEAWELFQELLPHYSDEVAGESFEELELHRYMKEADGGLRHWRIELQYHAKRGELKELAEVLGRHPEAGAEDAGQALTTAIAAMELAAARMLIEAGADVDAVTSYERRRGSCPLASAAESWHRRSADAMRMLLDAGADVNQRDSSERSVLMYAVHLAYRHEAPLRKAIPILIEAGADLNAEDKHGHTAWSLAMAPVIEAEEIARLGGSGDTGPSTTDLFDSPDLSDIFSKTANQKDQRRNRVDRCREVVALLEAAGAEPHREAELRLLVAAAADHGERIRELLATGADPDARGIDGFAAIAAAAHSGRLEPVELLIEAGCDVNASAVNRKSALEVAVRGVDEPMTRALVDAGANVYMLISMSRDALVAAEAAGGADLVAMLRERLPPELAHIDQDIDDEIEADDLAWDSQRALPRQAAMGDLAKVRELLTVKGVEIDDFDACRRTPLMAAAEAGQHEVVRELLAGGADPGRCNEIVGSPRSTPLACAAISSSADRDGVLRLLLEAGADPDQVGADGRTALMHAVERDVGFFGRVGAFALSTRTLIDAGADLEIRDPYGLTAWMRAMSLATSIDLEDVTAQYETIAELLESAGASTAGKSEIQLLWAVMVEEAEEVQKHLSAGADAGARRFDGATGLILAVRDHRVDVARMLIEAGADAHAKQWVDRGPTAMDAATSAEDRRLIRLLVDAGIPSPDLESRHRRT
ncbi:MAG: hypothetical protein GY719_27015 [bacterium]|nr:hypothetical protein [bacterium]